MNMLGSFLRALVDDYRDQVYSVEGADELQSSPEFPVDAWTAPTGIRHAHFSDADG
jgi:hypothetical protein